MLGEDLIVAAQRERTQGTPPGSYLMPELIGKRVTNQTLRRMKNLSRIKSLSLVQTAVDDQGMEALAAAQNLEEIQIMSDKISDRSMPLLCSLPRLVSLLLDGVPKVTNAGIGALRNTTNIAELYLNGTQLNDDGVDAILHLSKLGSLCLSDTQVTDAAVERFGVFPELNLLELGNTGVHGPGLSALSGTRWDLYLDGCPISDEGIIAGLRNLSTVWVLDISRTFITDESLARISRIPELADLRLSDTAVTDGGMAHLMGHPNLMVLYVKQTKVTQECIDRLKEESPKRLIVYK